jgi:hypothetical protein
MAVAQVDDPAVAGVVGAALEADFEHAEIAVPFVTEGVGLTVRPWARAIRSACLGSRAMAKQVG